MKRHITAAGFIQSFHTLFKKPLFTYSKVFHRWVLEVKILLLKSSHLQKETIRLGKQAVQLKNMRQGLYFMRTKFLKKKTLELSFSIFIAAFIETFLSLIFFREIYFRSLKNGRCVNNVSIPIFFATFFAGRLRSPFDGYLVRWRN